MAYAVEADNSFADFTELQTEVAAWFTDQAESEGRTGPIADWDVQLVDSLYKLFNDKEAFNEDIRLGTFNASRTCSIRSITLERLTLTSALGTCNASRTCSICSMKPTLLTGTSVLGTSQAPRTCTLFLRAML